MSNIYVKDTGLKLTVRATMPEGAVRFKEFPDGEQVQRTLENIKAEDERFGYMLNAWSKNGRVVIKGGSHKYASRLRAAAKDGIMEPGGVENAVPSRTTLRRMKKADLAMVGGFNPSEMTRDEMLNELLNA